MEMLTRYELDTMHAVEVVCPTVENDHIAILDEECRRAEHVLTPTQAIAFAERLITLARQCDPLHTEPRREMRRLSTVDDLLREMDQ